MLFRSWEDVPILGDEASGSGPPFGIDDEAGLSDVMVITDSAGVFQHRGVVYVWRRTRTRPTDATVSGATLSFHLPSTQIRLYFQCVGLLLH